MIDLRKGVCLELMRDLPKIKMTKEVRAELNRLYKEVGILPTVKTRGVCQIGLVPLFEQKPYYQNLHNS